MIIIGMRQRRMADRILEIVERIVPGKGKLEEYVNGRENGYVLTNHDGKSVTFSEYRNSDQAVVYLIDWNNSTDSDRDAAYYGKSFFNTAGEAAKFIKKYFANKP